MIYLVIGVLSALPVTIAGIRGVRSQLDCWLCVTLVAIVAVLDPIMQAIFDRPGLAFCCTLYVIVFVIALRYAIVAKLVYPEERSERRTQAGCRVHHLRFQRWDRN
jgi:hypothetical protein